MQRKTPLVEGETYHLYNRGAHKQNIFNTEGDYWRMLFLLYLANQEKPIVIRDILGKYRGRSSVELLGEPRDKNLVDILAYCLMPNHFHLVLRQTAPGGITKFMGRVATGYAMYYNLKHDHSGTLFQGRFKSKHIDTEPYFRYIFSYTHLNPLELFDPVWKERGVTDVEGARAHMHRYQFSSFLDYAGTKRPQGVLLATESIPDFLRTQNDLDILLKHFTEDGPQDRRSKVEVAEGGGFYF